VLFVTANGCSPADSSQSDEEQEPHFVLGNNRFNELDYNGAVEAFAESLEVNPHSAQAHYRLAQIFDSKEPDPAAAIYHYQEYLRLSPDANNRDVIQQRINSCKQQLATDVLQLPSSPAMQNQLNSLVDQNHKLQAQVDQLNGVIKQWNAYYVSEQAAARNNPTPVTVQNNAGSSATSQLPDDISTQITPLPAPPKKSTPVAPPRPRPPIRTHIVAAGETLAGIARKAGVSLTALQSVNPGLNPRKLRPGMKVNLPP
jgi:LysM repeat protein